MTFVRKDTCTHSRDAPSTPASFSASVISWPLICFSFVQISISQSDSEAQLLSLSPRLCDPPPHLHRALKFVLGLSNESAPWVRKQIKGCRPPKMFHI